MAKDEFDDLDLDGDFDLDNELAGLDDVDSLSNPTKTGDRNPVEASLKSAGKGIKEALSEDGVMKQAAKLAAASVPKSLSREHAEIMDVASTLRDEYKTAINDIKGTAKQTLASIDSVLLDKGILKSIVTKLRSKVDDSGGYRGPSKEEVDNANIATALDEVFNKQLKAEEANNLVANAIESNRHRTTTDLLSTIASNSEYTRKFNFEIANSYYRRSLELQYKHLFTSKEQLGILKAGIDTFKNQFESIIKNTSLPDIIKMRQTEALKENIQQHARESLSQAFYSDINPLMQLKKNAVAKIKSTASDFNDGLAMAGDMADQYGMMNEMSGMVGGKGYLAGRFIGDLGRDFVGGKIANKLASTKRGKDTIYDIKNNMADVNGYFNRSAEAAASDPARNKDGNLTLANRLKYGMFSTLGSLSDANGTNKANFNTIEQDAGAVFDGRVHTSIVKIIPGLLSKIYGEIKSIRTRSSNPSDNELHYDHMSDTFKSKADIAKGVRQTAAKRIAGSMIYYVDNLISKYEEATGRAFNNTDKSIMRKGITSYLISKGATNPSALMSSKFLSHFDKKFAAKLKKYGAILLTNARNDPYLMDSLIDTLKGIKANIPNVNSTLVNLHATGLNEVSESLGLIKRDKLTGLVKQDEEGNRKFILSALGDLDEDMVTAGTNRKREELAKLAGMKSKFGFKRDKKGKVLPDLQMAKDRLAKGYQTARSATSPYINAAQQQANKAMDSIHNSKAYKWGDTKFGISSKVIDSKKKYEQLKEEFFTSDLYKNSKDKMITIEDYAKGMGYTISNGVFSKSNKEQVVSDIQAAKEKIATYTTSTITGIKEIDTKEKYDELKTEFFKSEVYKKGIVTTLKDYASGLNYKLKEDVFTQTNKDQVITEITKAKEKMKKALDDTKTKAEELGITKEQTIDKLKEEFFKSKEYQSGAITDFTEWVSALGYKVKNKSNTFKDMAKNILSEGINLFRNKNNESKYTRMGNLFRATRALDRKIMGKVPGAVGSMVKGGAKLTGKAIGLGAKGMFALPGFIATNTGLKKARALDRKAMANAPGALGSLFGMLGGGVKSLFGKKNNLGLDEGIKPDKRRTVEESLTEDQKRSGNWMSRLSLFGKKKTDAKANTPTEGEKPKGNSLLDLLKPAIGLLIPKIGKILSVGKTLMSAIPMIPKVLGKLIPFLSSIAGGIGSTLMKGASAVAPGVATAATFVKNKAVATGSKVANGVKLGFSKIKAILSGFKTTAIKKLGRKGGAKLIAVIGSKIAARAVPIAGAALVAYDVTMIGKDMVENKTSLGSAVSKQILGFDIYDKGSVAKDANGNPITPDENLKAVNSKATTTDDNTTVKPVNGKLPASTTEASTNQTPPKEKSFTDKAKESLSSAFDSFKSGAKQAYDYTSNKISSGYQAAKGVAGDMWNAAKSLVGKGIGAVAGFFESGKAGAGTVSTGRGDFGGASYGTHQFASKNGSLQAYLKSSKYGAEFQGLQPGSPAFNAKWKEIAARDPEGFSKDQEQYITATHFLPMKKRLAGIGLNLDSRSKALNSAVFSIGVQFGSGSKLVDKALAAANLDPKSASDKEIIDAIYKYKQDNNATLFKSSSGSVKQGTFARAGREHQMVLKLLETDKGVVSAANGTTKPTAAVTPPANNTTLPSGKPPLPNSTPKTAATAPTVVAASALTKTTTNNTSTPVAPTPVTISSGINKANTTPTAISRADTAKLSLASDSHGTLTTVSDTLTKSLQVQIRMANALEALVKSSGGNLGNKTKAELADTHESKAANVLSKTPPKDTTLPNPGMNLKRKTY